MKAVCTIPAHRGQAEATVRGGAPSDAVRGAVPELVVARGPNQATGRVLAVDGKPSHDTSADRFGSIWTVRGFLLVQIAMFLVLVSIHFGLLMTGYGHRAAGITELVIAAVLLFGLLLTWRPPPWCRRAAMAAQSFGTLGVLVGLFTIALGVGPRTILDLSLNVVLLLTLIAGVASTKRGAGHVHAA